VTLDVHFKLTDLEYQPLPGVSVRLVFGTEPGWQNPDAGDRFVTDSNGEHSYGATAMIDQRLRKMPTNFIRSLFSRKQTTDHLAVAAELEFLTYHWLYAFDLYRFPGGDVLFDGLSVYTPDALGRFTNRATHDESGWRMTGLSGLVLTTPGHEPWNFMLQPDPTDPTHKKWDLQIAVKRSPAPVRR